MIKINFLGDSITYGYAVKDMNNCFVNIIGSTLPAEVRNYGISGTRFAKQIVPSLSPSYDLYFGSRVKDMNHDANLVVVFGGTNDFGHGDAPIGNDNDRSPDTFYGGTHYLINELLKHYKKEQLLFVLPLHRLWETCVYGNGEKEVASLPLSGYVSIIESVCKEHDIETLDYRKEMGEAINNPYLADGLHLNDKGHIKFASLLIEDIKRKLLLK